VRDLWYKNAVIYGLDVETFADGDGDGVGDFRGLTSRLPYLAGLGVTCLWLLPFYPTPNRDNGYDVVDYYGVDRRLGTLGDFVQFMHEAEECGLRVIIDLVVNHTSDQHPWFKSARRDPASPFRDWYVWSKRRPPNADEGMVFPGVQKSIWTYDRQARAYYLHHFYDFQPDLNVSNPAVREEIQRIMGYWLRLGVSGFRVDAAPFLIEYLGLPDKGKVDPFVHIREMHDFLSWRRGDGVLLAEANVPMKLLGEYFGDGNRMHILYNFAVNRSLFAALALGQARPLIEALRALPDLPEVGQWGTFLRNADEIDLSGLSEEDSSCVYAACGPEPDMQLYDRGIRRRLAPMLRGNPRKIALAFSLLFSLPGTPVLYYGDEIGMGDDLSLPERNSVRTPMQWTGETNGGFSAAPRRRLVRPVVQGGPYGYETVNVLWSQRDPDSILNHVERLIRTYKQLPALGRGAWSVLETDQPSVLAHRTDWAGESLLVLHNLAEGPCEARLKERPKPAQMTEVLSDGSGYVPATDASQPILLEGHGFRWFRLDGDLRTTGGAG
jgi:maltose alpha-D-glucosyltransferase/alpha-amylase